MNLDKMINKMVVLQLRQPFMVCGYDKSGKGIAPMTFKREDGEHSVLSQFIIGFLRQDDETNDYWIEMKDQMDSGALIRIDVAPDLISYCCSLQKEPSRLIMHQ